MKKSISILTLLLIAGSITFVNAFDDPRSTSGVLKQGSTVKVLYKASELSDVKIFILNEHDQIVFTEKIKNTDGFSRPYNLSNLPQGNYKIKLLDNGGTHVEHISHIIKPVKRSRVTYVARVKGSADSFILSVPNKGNDDISITIYNADDAILYSGKETITGDFAKIYKLKNYNGKIKFVVTDSKGLTGSWTRHNW
jgi:hypothetical protein